MAPIPRHNYTPISPSTALAHLDAGREVAIQYYDPVLRTQTFTAYRRMTERPGVYAAFGWERMDGSSSKYMANVVGGAATQGVRGHMLREFLREHATGASVYVRPSEDSKTPTESDESDLSCM
jgi:hypothetical protein